MYDPEITWYKALVLITSALGIGFGITNIVYFNRVRLEGQCGPISTSTATTLVWLNIFLVIFSAIIFFWSFFRLVFTGRDVDTINQSYNLHTHLHNAPDILPSPPVVASSPVAVISEQGYQV